MNTLFASFIPSRNDFIIRLGSRNNFPLNQRDVSRASGWHLQWNPEQRAQLVYHSLRDALRIYSTVAGTCFSCSWLCAGYIYAHLHACVYAYAHAYRRHTNWIATNYEILPMPPAWMRENFTRLENVHLTKTHSRLAWNLRNIGGQRYFFFFSRDLCERFRGDNIYLRGHFS